MKKDFYKTLQELNLTDIIREVPYKLIHFHGFGKVFKFLEELRNDKNAKVLTYGDYDPDGAMSALTVDDTLEYVGIKNREVFHYVKRTHDLDKAAVRQCIQGGFNYFIVCDTASSDMSTLNMLTTYGVKVIVLDHHDTMYDYEDYNEKIAIINTVIENRIAAQDVYALSAGALAFCVMDTYLHEIGMPPLENTIAYALVSLYSDCMNMSNVINRGIYHKAKGILREDLPIYIKHFLGEHQAFNSRFIGFWFAPRINAMFRSERFEILNLYFFCKNVDSYVRARCIEDINHYYNEDRKMVGILADIVDAEPLKNFVVCNLASAVEKTDMPFYNLQNYTGLVANKLAERYGRTAVAYYEFQNAYKGSVRDQYGRDYLNIFRQICYAGGHNSAFGLKINLLELEAFLESLYRIDLHYSIDTVGNEPIIIEHNYSIPDDAMIEDMALYNEFSGNSVPVAFIAKQLIGAMREMPTKFNYKYPWGKYFVQSDYSLCFGTKMIVKPIKSGVTKLLFQQ